MRGRWWEVPPSRVCVREVLRRRLVVSASISRLSERGNERKVVVVAKHLRLTFERGRH